MNRNGANPVTLPGDELVAEALRGVPGAANALWEGYAPYLMRVAMALSQSPEEAREIVQETLLAGFRYLESYDPARPFRPWIHRILVNQYRSWRRKWWGRAARFTSLSGNGTVPSGEDIESNVRARQLWRCSLSCLGRTQRVVWALTVMGELETEEVAAVLGIQPATVRSHLSKGRARIRRSIFGVRGETE